MKLVVIGAHLLREDVEPIAEALPVGDLFLSVLPIAGQQPLGDRDLLLRVAEVRRRLLDRATFVAVRYGFTVTSSDDAVQRCAPHLVKWRSLLETYREHAEMTLKVAVNASPRPDRREHASGSSYLRALHESARKADADPVLYAAVERLLIPLAHEHRWLHGDRTSTEFVALVRRERLGEFEEAGRALKNEVPSTPFLLSGPWPLEVFADADHE